jgi:CheY-like chemotaxis protein
MRVLIVEDNPITGSSLCLYLQEHGHEAEFVGDGLSALTKLSVPGEFLPDVILSDWRMPGMDGGELLERLQQREEWKRIPVALWTAASLDDQITLKKKWDSVRFLPKPYDPKGLLDALKEIGTQREIGDSR